MDTKKLYEVTKILKKHNAQDLLDAIDSNFRKIELLSNDNFIVDLFFEITEISSRKEIEKLSLEEREKVISDFLASYGVQSLNVQKNQMNKQAMEIILKEQAQQMMIESKEAEDKN